MRAVEVLEKGIADGLHVGAQLSVSRDGKAVADVAVGEARPNVPMTTGSLMTWFSMTKAITAVAVAQQWERGAIELDDPVVMYVPEFGPSGKDRITIRHLLTHTAGIPWADGILEGRIWTDTRVENLERIYAAPLEAGWEPGKKAGYHAASGMSVLGEIVERTAGLPYDRYVRDEIFEPLGMDDCWIGMPPERFRAYGNRIAWMHNTAKRLPKPIPRVDTEEATARPVPGANGRGPMRQLLRFYEMLLADGERDGARVLSSQTVAAISARHRVGMEDSTFGIVVDWGLGFAIDTYIMGRHSSPRAFGHGGHESSAAFCDPEHGVAMAVVCNGTPGGPRHYARMDAIATAVYEDLGIGTPGEGREKPYPIRGL